MTTVTVLEVPRGNPWDGTGPCWGPVDDASGEIRAVVCCPAGHPGAVRHQVAGDGTLHPSYVCPGDPAPGGSGETCDWHVWLRLLDWTSPT